MLSETHYISKYESFIASRSKRILSSSEYVETHHIVPSCMGGSDDKSNLIKLSLREHYIAHYLLANAYPHVIGLSQAVMLMGKRTQLDKHLYKNSKVYQECRKRFIESRKGMVYCKDSDGNSVYITSEQYKNGDYTFHTSGMVSCYDLEGNFHYVTCMEYALGDYVTIHNGGVYCLDSNGSPVHITVEEYRKGGYKHYSDDIVVCINEYGETVKVTREEYKNGNYTSFVKGMVACMDENGNTVHITVEQYKFGNYVSFAYNMVSCYDEFGDVVRVTREEFYSGNYTALNEGLVHCKDSDGNKVTVTCEQYKLGNYTFHTEGKVLAVDEFGNPIQVTQAEFKSRNLSTPRTGKVNVINKITGEKEFISTDDYRNNQDIYEYVNVGMVTCIDEHGVGICIPSEEFENRGLKTSTSGITNVRSIYKIGSYKIECGTMKPFEISVSRKEHWVYNTITGEEKILPKDEVVSEEWLSGKNPNKPEQPKRPIVSGTLGKMVVRSIYQIGNYMAIKNELKSHEISSNAKIYVHNPMTGEEKILSKTEYVSEEWKLGKINLYTLLEN